MSMTILVGGIIVADIEAADAVLSGLFILFFVSDTFTHSSYLLTRFSLSLLSLSIEQQSPCNERTLRRLDDNLGSTGRQTGSTCRPNVTLTMTSNVTSTP
jgi:hypothetical protein